MSTCSRCGAPLESRLAWSRAAHHGAESILQAVLLARPDRFHGRADFSGDARGHDGFLGEEAPAEATAHPGRVHGNGRRGQEQRQGDFPLHLRGRLGGSPDLGSEAMHASGGVERLELHVHEERGLVGRAYERVGPTDRLRQRVGSQALEQRRARRSVSGGSAGMPQLTEALCRPLNALQESRATTANVSSKCVTWTTPGRRSAACRSKDPSRPPGTLGHRRHEQAGQAHVEPVRRRAVDLGSRAQSGQGLTDGAPRRARLERWIDGRRKARRCHCKLAITCATRGCCMDHVAAYDVAIDGSQSPARCGGLDEHDASGRTDFACGREHPLNRRAAARIEADRTGVRAARRGHLDADAGWIGLQLFVEDLRQRRPDALTHLSQGAVEPDGAIGGNPYPTGVTEGRCASQPLLQPHPLGRQAHHEAATDGGTRDEKLTPGDQSAALLRRTRHATRRRAAQVRPASAATKRASMPGSGTLARGDAGSSNSTPASPKSPPGPKSDSALPEPDDTSAKSPVPPVTSKWNPPRPAGLPGVPVSQPLSEPYRLSPEPSSSCQPPPGAVPTSELPSQAGVAWSRAENVNAGGADATKWRSSPRKRVVPLRSR